jgi:hypothetical protein
MTCHGHAHCVWAMLPEAGAAFDIGEEKGDGTGGQLAHGAPQARSQAMALVFPP